MGNKSSKTVTNIRPSPKLDPLEETLSGIISRATKENDIRYKDLDRFSTRVSIFDANHKVIDKGLKMDDEDAGDEKEQNTDQQKWKRVKNILLCISELYAKYNKTEDNDIFHSKLCNILNFCKNMANNSNELCRIIMNSNDDFGSYKALNIPSALCQSNAQVAFTYLTFGYLTQRGYDASAMSRQSPDGKFMFISTMRMSGYSTKNKAEKLEISKTKWTLSLSSTGKWTQYTTKRRSSVCLWS